MVTGPGQGVRRKVLIVDDDRRLLVALSRGLALRDFDVQAVETPGEAVPHLERSWPDVLVLDVAMPGMDGVTFCGLVRERFNVPILMLTARDSVEDRVTGLNAGADDYVPKPFALDELVARLEALIRRAAGTEVRSQLLSYAGLAVDRDRWTASRDGSRLPLTTLEFKLLEALILRPEHVLTRDELLQSVWGDANYDSNVVDVHIANLRRKLEEGGRARIIQTVRRGGYKLEAE